MTSDNIREMFAPQKKSDIRNLFIRRKNMEKDPEEERKREEGKALLQGSCWDTPRWRCWQVRCWELLWQC